ncbi:MAG TPA: spore germination protein [Negativicutes bacterium]|nr:spore germination protein [Negativicutes bacterium]
MNIITKNFKALKELILYKPPEIPSPFVLGEKEEGRPEPVSPLDQIHADADMHASLLRCAERLAKALEKARKILAQPLRTEALVSLAKELEALQEQQAQLTPLLQAYNRKQDPLDQTVSTSLQENRLMLERLYNLPANKDLVMRELTIPGTPPVAAILFFIDGLIDKDTINLAVLQPLMLLGNTHRQLYDGRPTTRLITEYLPSNQVRTATTFGDVLDSLNLGDTALFLDGVSEAVLLETKGQEHRSIDRPQMEQSVRGSQSAFTETLRVNTGLVRAILRTSDLTTEISNIGVRSNTLCAVMYLHSLVNPRLVQEMKRRLDGIKVDHVTSAGALLLQLIDHPMLPFPQALTTERPDRVAAALLEGRLAVLLDGSPFAIVAPISMFTLFHTGEDFSFSWIAASFLRLLRFIGTFLTLTLPAIYIAISYFHQEAIPTDMILAIAAARERVPFPSILEILMMEFAFELLREAGTRIPSLLGPSIGIVGGIILGQAAVSAGIVSPITVVIVAVTGLASFAIPDYSYSYAIRLFRFVLEILAFMLGLVGVACGLLALTALLCSVKSLGVPYLSPVAPKTRAGYDIVLRGPIYTQELRPDDLNAQDRRRQAGVSRQWREEPPAGREE